MHLYNSISSIINSSFEYGKNLFKSFLIDDVVENLKIEVLNSVNKRILNNDLDNSGENVTNLNNKKILVLNKIYEYQKFSKEIGIFKRIIYAIKIKRSLAVLNDLTNKLSLKIADYKKNFRDSLTLTKPAEVTLKAENLTPALKKSKTEEAIELPKQLSKIAQRCDTLGKKVSHKKFLKTLNSTVNDTVRKLRNRIVNLHKLITFIDVATYESSKELTNNNLFKAIEFHNEIVKFVKHSILSRNNLNESLNQIHFWILTADKAFKEENFEGAGCIFEALISSDVSKLVDEFIKNNKNYMKTYETLTKAYSPQNNYRILREIIEKANFPTCYLPCLAKDIEFKNIDYSSRSNELGNERTQEVETKRQELHKDYYTFMNGLKEKINGKLKNCNVDDNDYFAAAPDVVSPQQSYLKAKELLKTAAKK